MNRVTTTLTAFGLALALAGCTGMSGPSAAASTSSSANIVAGPGAGVSNPVKNPDVPGATGNSIVPGDNSTIAGDAAATIMQRTGRV
jgi:hypothetical protein